MSNVPITFGSGQASIAGDTTGGTTYQQIKVVDGTVGGTTGLIVNADGTLNARISGSVLSAGSTFNGSVSGTVGASIIGIAPVFIVGGSIAGTFTTPNQSVSGTVQTDVRGSVGTVIIGGSIAASFTPPANQSVSGAVQIVGVGGIANTSAQSLDGESENKVGIAGQAYQYVYNGTSWDRVRGNSSVGALVNTGTGSVITVAKGSVATTIINTNLNVGGSVVAFQGGPQTTSIMGGASVFQTGTWQVSVAGVVNTAGSVAAFIQGTPNVNTAGSVVAFQGTNPWIITGSVQGSFTSPANQSISGTVQADIRGSVAAVIIGGSIATATTNSSVTLLNGSNTIGSVTALQGTNPWIVTSSIAGGLFPISGSVAATITNTNVNVGGSVAAWLNSSNASIITVGQGSIGVAIISGSIAATFTPPANQSVSGTVQTDVRGSVAVAIISGSIAASFTPPANQSVSGTVNIGTGGPVSVLGTMSVLGTVPVTQSGAWTASVIGTYPDSFVASTVTGIPFMFKANVSSSIMQAVSPTFPLPVLISGSVAAALINSVNQSVSGTVGASVVGQLPAGTAMLGSVVAYQGVIPWTIGSVYGNISGSVAAFVVGNASVITVSQGSVAVTQSGTWKASIASNYATGAASVVSALGNLSLGVRNDTLASLLATSDGQYIPWTVGPAGENIVANAPMNKWVQGTADFRSNTGGSVTVIAAGGTSIFTYITGLQIANMGSASVLVTLSGATVSVIGYTIAPAGGGSNIVYPTPLKTSANGAFAASISGVSSVLVSAQGFISKT